MVLTFSQHTDFVLKKSIFMYAHTEKVLDYLLGTDLFDRNIRLISDLNMPETWRKEKYLFFCLILAYCLHITHLHNVSVHSFIKSLIKI